MDYKRNKTKYASQKILLIPLTGSLRYSFDRSSSSLLFLYKILSMALFTYERYGNNNFGIFDNKKPRLALIHWFDLLRTNIRMFFSQKGLEGCPSNFGCTPCVTLLFALNKYINHLLNSFAYLNETCSCSSFNFTKVKNKNVW